ncbi:MAG: glucose 1-dehydrogenase [Alphaproteobacteria bacterium]|nr:glucose 1-dehydrogenase [Alphaproteobacteria bacterium]
MNRLAGKVALVTGGASGLGRQSAIRMAEEGAKVAVADLNHAGAEIVAREIGASAIALALDVTSESQWQAAIGATLAAFGKLNVLLNSAGVGVNKDIENTTMEEWRFVNGVNLDGTFLGCKHGVIAMKAHPPGSIINISSVSGLVGGHNLAAYNASKGGVRLLSKSVALHCARKGYSIRCNSLHPTFIDTPMVRAMFTGRPDAERVRQKLEAQVPLGHIGEPDDIAWAVVYLASDESKFVTGAEFVVDGGITAM